MSEELGIDVLSYRLLGSFYKTYHRGNNIYTDIVSMIYDVKSYNGIVINKEPKKHLYLQWMTISEIKKDIQKSMMSDALKFYIAIKGILK